MTDHSTEREGLIARLNESDDINNVKMPRHSAYLLLCEAAAALAEPCPGPHLVPVDESAEDAWYALAEPVVKPTLVPTCDRPGAEHRGSASGGVEHRATSPLAGSIFTIFTIDANGDRWEPCPAESARVAQNSETTPAEMTDEQALAEIVEAAQQVFRDNPPNHCVVPPVGWMCSRESGHDGPCAARQCSELTWRIRRAQRGIVDDPAPTGPTEAQVLRDALTKIATACHNSVTGDCWAEGRDPNSEFTAYRVCDACIARAALTAALEVKP